MKRYVRYAENPITANMMKKTAGAKILLCRKKFWTWFRMIKRERHVYANPALRNIQNNELNYVMYKRLLS